MVPDEQVCIETRPKQPAAGGPPPVQLPPLNVPLALAVVLGVVQE
jgi:hypothetical protein